MANEFSDGAPGSYLRQKATEKQINDNQTEEAAQEFSGSYSDLTDKPEIPELPLVGDDFVNDAAAAIGGIDVGKLYHTSGAVKIRLA